MHLHLGIDATGLPEDLECHHLFVNNWANLAAEQNVCIASIPTVFDPSLAPEGKAVVHAYTAANEPWDLWQGLDTKSEAYKRLKEERSECLWLALERVRSVKNVCILSIPIVFVSARAGGQGGGACVHGGQ
jgi:phytoene dehydrogenase-like protein